MKDIMLFGMQGSGKGTQAKLLVQKHGYKMFETGAELRAMAESGTELGNRVKSIMNEGRLVDTKIIMEIVEAFVHKLAPSDAVIFDGIPRSMEQMEAFEKVMHKVGRSPLGVNIKLTKEEALGRLVKRFTCVGVDMTNNPLMTEAECIALGGTVKRRADDTPEAISVRLDAFFNETQPVIEAYKGLNRMVEVHGVQLVEQVTKEVERMIND